MLVLACRRASLVREAPYGQKDTHSITEFISAVTGYFHSVYAGSSEAERPKKERVPKGR